MNAIETIDLTKKFGNFTANDGIHLCVKKGEIKAIVGENGAGKSTLMNMLYGMIEPTRGQILVYGKPEKIHSPLDAIRLGLGMVHQHFKLVPSLTVYENIMLGTEITMDFAPFTKRKHLDKHLEKTSFSRCKLPLPFIHTKEERKRIQALIETYHFDLNPDDKIKDISIGAQQRVEILKMLYRNVDILILDEPTAVLTPREVEELICNLKKLRDAGKTLIVITHKLHEVMELSDSVAVIKQGKIVGQVATKEVDEKKLAQMMVGRDVVLRVKNNPHPPSPHITYCVENISTHNAEGKEVLHNISFCLREGEILGVAGVEGNGQAELIKVLTGLMKVTSGKVTMKGKDITNAWPHKLRATSIAIIPEDRYAQGLCQTMSIADNCISGYHTKAEVCKHGFLDKKFIQQKRNKIISQYDVRVSDVEGNISDLSGGNAQKIIIGREMDANPEILIASQPTRGVDVGSIEFIHNQLLQMRDKNKAVLLISSELNEILSLSSRIIVMYKGSIIGERTATEATKESIGLLMAGIV